LQKRLQIVSSAVTKSDWTLLFKRFERVGVSDAAQAMSYGALRKFAGWPT
jgi:hypothetical protein